MPNAVDITEVPDYNTISPSANKGFIRQMVIYFNTAFSTMLSNGMVSCPGLTIYEPDFFTLLDNILANPAAYGVTNALYLGQSIDVITAYNNSLLSSDALNGPGTNYIFWDSDDPTAKVHAIMAGAAKQLIAPVQFSKIASLGGSNRLDMTNVPVGLGGVVNGSTDLVGWTSVTNFSSTNSTQSVFVPVAGPSQFYRLSFPLTWIWP
jgi:phospholipase/lecithinase/hemolysin